MAKSARRTRPPSIGKAGIKLNKIKNTLAQATLSSSSILGLSKSSTCWKPEVTWVTRRSDRGNHHIHQRAGDGDNEFLPRLLRNTVEPRDAADGVQGNVAGPDTKGARRKSVTEFVQSDASEQDQNIDDPLDRARSPPPGKNGTKRTLTKSRKLTLIRTSIPKTEAIFSEEPILYHLLSLIVDAISLNRRSFPRYPIAFFLICREA